ncbi:MAG TPA: PilZ domain-containing protein [Candidatus Angelobacter sp.]|nr:PilZ domain-containing protein [Candidatus Angelobacter sp.]
MPSTPMNYPWKTPRAFPRFLIDIRLLIRAKETLNGRTKDIGEGGLGATIPATIEMGEIVELEFQLPATPETLRLKAEVRYNQGFQYGFRFIRPSDHYRELIRNATRDLALAP